MRTAAICLVLLTSSFGLAWASTVPSGPGGPLLCLLPADSFIAPNRTFGATVVLPSPAPAGGLSVALQSSNPLVATIAPAVLVIPAGATSSTPGMITITGVGLGSATLSAAASGFPLATAPITTTNQLISLAFGLAVIPGQTAGLAVSLSVPAPPGGLTVAFSSTSPAVATVQSSVFIPAGQLIPAANPMVSGVALGSTTITASAPGFAPDARMVSVASNVISIDPHPVTVAETFTATFNVRLQVSAPPSGQPVTLSVDQPGIATVPISAIVPSGENTVMVVISGVSTGTTILRANATGLPEATATVNVVPPAISLSNDDIGDDLMVTQSVTLSAPAPAGNLQVTLTSNDPSRILLSTTPGALGATSITVTVPAGQSVAPAHYVHGLAETGQGSVFATAPAFASATAIYTLHPSGFRIWSPTAISVSTGVAPVPVSLRATRLSAALAPVEQQALRGGISVAVPVTSSMISVGSIVASPITFQGGSFSATAEFEPHGPGTTIVTLATPLGFQTPATSTQITANVFSQGLNLSSGTIGDDLQILRIVTSSAPAPAGNLAVTLTSSDPTRLLLSASPTQMGSASVTLTIGAGSSQTPSFYVQARADSGTADVTATAPGFGPGIATYTFTPSGFIIWSPSVINASTGTPASTLSLRSVALDPATLAYAQTQTVSGGVSVSVDVTSSNPSVGTITQSPVMFFGGDLSKTTGFLPLLAGTTQLTVVTPPSFDTPSTGYQIAANVFDQSISFAGTDVGDDLQTTRTVTLSAPAPAGNLALTVTSTDPARALVSLNATDPGSSSVTLQVNAGQVVSPTFYVHGLDDQGSVDVVASAAGYADGIATFGLRPSAFVIWTPAAINTNTFASTVALSLRSMMLAPATLQPITTQAVRGGLAIPVSITTSDSNVGTISQSPVTFLGGSLIAASGFNPLTAGVSTLAVIQPAGFDTPAALGQITATVTAPAITLADATVGRDLQTSSTLVLASTPPNPVNVTLTVNDPSLATITLDPLVAGTGSLTLPGVTGTNLGQIWIQGRALGSTSILVQAAGYADRIAAVNIHPSGFVFWTPSSITTTPLSPVTSISVRPARLHPVTLNLAALQNVRGGLSVVVPMTNSTPAVGSLTVNPLTFAPNVIAMSTGFQPAAPGQTTLGLVTPSGFFTSSNLTQIPVVVDAPDIQLQNVTVGVNLQTSTSVTLQAAPSSATVFDLKVDDPTIAVLSTNATTLGSGRIQVTASTTFVGTIYVQGLRRGTTIIRAKGPGYDLGSATITVDPSGFVIWSPSTITTSTFSAPTALSLRPARLHPVTLNLVQAQSVRAGLGGVRVLIASGDSSVGRTAVGALHFQDGDLVRNTTFLPNAAGSTIVALTTPSGFDTPSNQQTIPVTVAAPTITVGNLTVGEDLQASFSVTLQAAPPTPTTFTCTLANGALATLSSSATVLGTGTLTLPGVTTQSISSLRIHGLAIGTTTLTISAPGYQTGTATVTVNPSGFRIWSPSAITTTVGATPVSISVRPTMLDPVTLNVTTAQALRAGLVASVVLSSANATVGTVVGSPLLFTGGDLSLIATFQPLAVGSTQLSLATPPNFHSPSNGVQIPATVNP